MPIVIDTNDVIIAGETRLKASKLLQLDKVPCIIADELTDEQIKAFRLIENKTSEFATWDFEKLQEELKAIDIDIGLYNFPELDDVELNVSDDDFLKDTEIVRNIIKRQQRVLNAVRCLNHESISCVHRIRYVKGIKG